MSRLHVSPHTVQLTKTFAQGSLLTVIGIVSAITAATLIYVWLFT